MSKITRQKASKAHEKGGRMSMIKAKVINRALKIETRSREIWLFADRNGWDFIYLLPSLFLNLQTFNGNFTLQFGFLCFTVCLDSYKIGFDREEI